MRSESIEAEVKRARRRFLADCGKFAVATPPAISLLLAASRANYAVASSGGRSSGGGSAPMVDPSPPMTGGTSNTAIVNASTTNPTGGTAAGRSCGNTFEALVNNDKCFR